MKLRAKLVTAKSTAEKKAAKSTSSPTISASVLSETPASPKRTVPRPILDTVAIMAARLTTAVSRATVTTAAYLASKSCMRGTGEAMSVSSVPRSRSPAVRSMAG